MIFPYRDKNHPQTFPIFTIMLIIANCLVFLYQLTLSSSQQEYIIYQMGFIPTELTHMTNIRNSAGLHPVLTIFTSMFIHGGFLHLFGNMLYLWIFGDNVEDKLGHFKFLFFYILCGVIAALAHVVSDPNSIIPCVGASGAIAGILGAYLVLFPHARILCILFLIIIIRVIQLPAILVLSVWFILQFWSGARASSAGIGGIAFFAHIGGFVAGMVLILAMRKRRRRV